MSAPQSARRRWKIAAVVLGVVAVIGVSVALLADSAVTRDEVQERYSELVPGDASDIDAMTRLVCTGLDDGQTPAESIRIAANAFRDRATEVVTLFVSYGCPQHLPAFD